MAEMKRIIVILWITFLFVLTGNVEASSLYFNGTNSYVSIPDAPELSGGPGRSLTVEAWIFPTGPFPMTVLTKYLDWNNKDWGLVVNPEGLVGFQKETWSLPSPRGNWYTWSSESILTNQWTHTAFVFDNDNEVVQMYLNGALKGSRPIVNNQDLPDTTAPVWIGGPGPFYYGRDPTIMFTGFIDNVSIWDRALGADEILNTMFSTGLTGSEASLAAYWDFEMGADPDILYDLSDNSNHGTISGAEWSQMSSPVPEPSTMFLLSFGLVGLVGFRKIYKN